MARPAKILVFGATSAIAFGTAKLFARDGASLYLCARDEEDLKALSADLTVRGAKEVGYSVFNALDKGSIIRAVDDCLKKFPELDGLLIAYGTLPDQGLCETDIEEMRRAVEINFTSPAIILTYIAGHFEKKKQGVIAVISSVAGDRGRQSNYVYGAAKGALTTFLSGLRQRLGKSGVNVITVKPGFVDTPMTAGFKKGLLFVGPDVIAKGIYRAVKTGKSIAYVPWFWRIIMMIIRNIPEKIFIKIKL
ncbi:MAG: SDR family oxidoreductase [Nitrospiraceae bacterium]|nr:MAG: SDR family oxidoreductase [Nitrospiraceae bacterium]